MNFRRHWFRLSVALLLALSANRAEAHTVFSTNGPFFGGIKHFLLSPDDIIIAVAFGMFATLRRPKVTGSALWSLPTAWVVVGIIALLSGAAPATSEIPAACSLMAAGLLVALNLNLPALAVIGTGVVLGGLHGYLNGTAMREAGTWPAVLQLFGVGVSVAFASFWALAVLELADLAKRPWIRIVVRVLGSWTAASGLLLLGWSLRAVH